MDSRPSAHRARLRALRDDVVALLVGTLIAVLVILLSYFLLLIAASAFGVD